MLGVGIGVLLAILNAMWGENIKARADGLKLQHEEEPRCTSGSSTKKPCPYQPRPALPEALWDSVVRGVFTLPAETLLFTGHAHRGVCRPLRAGSAPLAPLVWRGRSR